MKKSLLVLASVSFIALAEEGDFNAHKQQILSSLDQRIAELQQTKTCISAAQDRAAVEVCHKEHRSEMMGHRLDRIERRKESLEMRSKKLSEKQENLNKKLGK